MYLSVADAKKIIDQLRAYKKSVQRKSDEFTRELASVGEKVAKARFDATTHADPDSLTVSCIPEKGKTTLSAKGRSVVFREFGEGAYLKRETQEEYPWDESPFPPPPWLVGHGEYGSGAPYWYYRGGPGDNPPPDTDWAKHEYVVTSEKPYLGHYTGQVIIYTSKNYTKTRGNKPAHAMLDADLEMRKQASDIAKGVFGK